MSFSVDRSQHVRLAVYDVLGRLQTVVHDGFAGPGTQRVLFDARGLASGTYFLRLEGSGASAARKIMVVR
jgi:hypothetical protein